MDEENSRVYISRMLTEPLTDNYESLGHADVCFYIEQEGGPGLILGDIPHVAQLLGEFFKTGHRNFYALPNPEKENPERQHVIKPYSTREKYPLLDEHRKNLENEVSKKLGNGLTIENKTEYDSAQNF
ncbi:hypothetical protein KY308_01785 [Candidatus Woesearchaeota archaeon]|nr:hypothetical protein [Candidatus Woesearchaeota archaeon]